MTPAPLEGTAAVASVFDRVVASYETVGPPFFDHFGALLVDQVGLHPGGRAEVADICGLSLPAASVDVVLCGFALFFLPDPPGALHSWARLLRPGGRLGVSTWGREDEVFGGLRDELARLGVDSRPAGQAYDDAAVLGSTLEQSGLVDVAVASVSLDLVLADVDELLRWGRTHGMRGWLDQLDEAGTAWLRAVLSERWPGEVPMSWQAHLAVAGRPAGPDRQRGGC